MICVHWLVYHVREIPRKSSSTIWKLKTHTKEKEKEKLISLMIQIKGPIDSSYSSGLKSFPMMLKKARIWAGVLFAIISAMIWHVRSTRLWTARWFAALVRSKRVDLSSLIFILINLSHEREECRLATFLQYSITISLLTGSVSGSPSLTSSNQWATVVDWNAVAWSTSKQTPSKLFNTYFIAILFWPRRNNKIIEIRKLHSVFLVSVINFLKVRVSARKTNFWDDTNILENGLKQLLMDKPN